MMRNLALATCLLFGQSSASPSPAKVFGKASPFFETVNTAPKGKPQARRLTDTSEKLFDFSKLISEGKPGRRILGYSRKGAPVEAWFFPGTSQGKALVVGGVHGSELSAIEVANRVVAHLRQAPKPYFNVVVVPQLFPDNAAVAARSKGDRHQTNAGRFSHYKAIDPNRQMPAPGSLFSAARPVDALGREMEKETCLLLQLIQDFAPSRIASLHAIREPARAGIYADPRTDCEGRALGFGTDSILALDMAGHIATAGGQVPGNSLRFFPTAVYHLDPAPSLAGEPQVRNVYADATTERLRGVSLGAWAATTVCNGASEVVRPAVRVITVEFPGYKRPLEYALPVDRRWVAAQTGFYASAINGVFLQDGIPD